MCLAACVGSALCCAGSACCSALCIPAKAAGVAAKNFAKIGYVVFSVCWIILVILMMYLFKWIFGWSDTFGIGCPDSMGGGTACAGTSALIRISWALAIFHVGMLALVALRTSWAAVVHDGCWGFKMLIVGGIWFVSLYIPNDPVLNGYMAFARIVSIIFLMYQALLVLLVAYSLNDLLVSNVEKEGGGACTCSGIILIVIFLLITAGNITWLIFQYIEFANEGCGANITFILISTVLGFIMHAIVIFRTRKDASILTSAIVWCYQLYLQWSAMASSPKVECNPYYTDAAGNTTAMIILGLVFTFLSLLVLGGSTTKGDDSTITGAASAHVMEKEDDGYRTVDIDDGKGSKINADEAHVFPISNATITF